KFKYTLHLSQVSTHTWYSKNVIVRFLSKIVVRNSSGIITMTEKAKQRLYKIKYLPSKNLIPKMVIGQPIDTNIFKPFSKTQVANIKSKLCINEKTKIILFVGKITPQKGLHVLIKSLNILNRQFNKDNFKLFVIGKTYTIKDDNYKEFLKKLIKKYDLNSKIEWLGYQSREKIIQFYNISNVLILPSIKLKKENTEAFGIVLVESMACQTPVIGSKLGGMKEIIKHIINGFLFSPNNYCELSKYINMILFDKNLEQKMGKNGRNYVINNYSFSAILNKYLDFYKSLI
ncbi:MAG: glycosyltransferase family 4 protein, partial [Candidatus Lokiarchaeota archaeon]